MRYTIFSIDDSRQHYVNRLEKSLREWERIQTPCVDGRDREQLQQAIDCFPYEINNDSLLVGQLGIWYSVLNAMQYAPIVTFEDDALLGANFMVNFTLRRKKIPEDFDFFTLFTPQDNNLQKYHPDLDVNYSVCKVYQRYGGVSMYYSEQGVEKIDALLRRDGITGQYDDTLYAYAKTGELNGYCPKPNIPMLVYITGHEQSIVQETESYA